MGGAGQMAVLIAEDDRATRNVHRFLLEIAGYKVVEAVDALSAIEVLRTYSAGMVALLDWDMPGAECMHILRGLARDPDIVARHRFVVLTSSSEALHSRLLALPASFFITFLRKPVKKAGLLSAVARAAQALPALPSGAVQAR